MCLKDTANTSNSTESLSKNSDQKIIYKYNQHGAFISKKLQQFYEAKDFFDTVLIAGEDCVKIPAHKIVLSALSEYFWETFRGHFHSNSTNTNEIKLEEIEAHSLKLIVDFMYSGSIEMSLENIEGLLCNAVILQVQTLIDGCFEFLYQNLNISNCLSMLRLANKQMLSELKQKSLNFIYTHFEEVTRQSEFLLLDKIELENLMFRENHYEDLEKLVFLGLIAWVDYEKVNRQSFIHELLSMVRYQFLEPKFIVEVSNLVSTTVENCKLVNGWLKYHLSPETRTSKQQSFALNSLNSEPAKKVNSRQEIDKLKAIAINKSNEGEIYDYDENLEKWILKKRSHPILTSILPDDDSKIVINDVFFRVGGVSSSSRNVTDTVESLDLKTFNFTQLPEMKTRRCGSQLADLNGCLCVFGGYEYSNFIDSMEIFDFSTGKWNNLNPPSKPSEQSGIVNYNGVLYIFDFHYGSIQCYDAASKKWTTKEQKIDDTVRDLRVVSDGNFIYAFCNSNNGKIIAKNFNLSNDTWSDVVENTEKTNSIIQMATIVKNRIFCSTYSRLLFEFHADTKTFSSQNKTGLENTSFLYLLP